MSNVRAHHNLCHRISLNISFRCVIKSNIPTKSNLFRMTARSICHVEVMSLYTSYSMAHKKNLHHCVISKRKKRQNEISTSFLCAINVVYGMCVSERDSTCDSCRFSACLNHPPLVFIIGDNSEIYSVLYTTMSLINNHIVLLLIYTAVRNIHCYQL